MSSSSFDHDIRDNQLDVISGDEVSATTDETTATTRTHKNKIDNAYEREPVPEPAYKGWIDFIGLFGSRHTAGTEFAIGPLFVARGATATDVVFGLLIGNILATLSWRYITAPIATSKRFTAYYAMERVVGKNLMYAYDALACLSLSLIGGAMFTVSATAVGEFFDVDMPELNDWLPTSWAFVGIVMFCGVFTTIVAIFGITFVTNFGTVATPILIAGITYMAVRSLDMLGIGEDDTNLWDILNEKVYPGTVVDDSFSKFGFAHCVFFAWFCDLQLHIGQNDQAILRYAKTPQMGWASAAGMFIGHYYAWIVAGIMYAVQLQEDPTNTSVAPGPIANLVGGIFGVIVVIIAGWSTANPVMYSGGLALQHAFPTMKASTSTLLVGSAATVAALFPLFTSRVLELLAFAGLALCPMGVILFADFWILPRLGIQNEMAANAAVEASADNVEDEANRYAIKSNTLNTTNWAAVYTWAIALIVSVPIAMTTVLEVFFTPLITVTLSLILYVGFSIRQNKGRSIKKVHEISTILSDHSPKNGDNKPGTKELVNTETGV